MPGLLSSVLGTCFRNLEGFDLEGKRDVRSRESENRLGGCGRMTSQMTAEWRGEGEEVEEEEAEGGQLART